MSDTQRHIPQRILVNEREAARMLSLSPRTLYTLRTRRQVPHLRVGRRVLYDVDLLRRWVAEQTAAQVEVLRD